MLNISEIKCVGCTACSSVCPKNVIRMKRDAEGFQHPIVETAEACIECGLCDKVCPVFNFKEETFFEQKGLIAQITDEKIRRESASGGMFSAIALSVLDEGGVVYGAAYNENFEVCHIGISRKDDLWKLRHSKYVQSNLVGVFPDVKKNLDMGKIVCFSGTPCQIEGLQFYLRKNYANLLLVDVVCHGVSSPLIWDKYLETIKKYNPNKIYFRWKHYGYKYSTMSFLDENDNEIYYAGVETDKMLRAYFSNNCDRDTCYECVFKKRYRTSDFTIWDFFQPRFFNKDFDDDRGTSGVLIHTEKASKQLDKIIAKNMIK
jgi:coenzyme F420-reducing hydrogenase beta subunit